MSERARLPADIVERALGAYLGLAVGDALGATVEFMDAETIAQRYGVHRKMVGGGWLNLPRGAVTDDTEMSLSLGAAITQQGRFELQHIADAFVTWLRSKPVDCGSTVRRGIGRYLRDGSLMGPQRDNDAGNGAVMRNLPVVLCSLGDEAAMTERTLLQCRLTHNHPYSDAAALALARITAALLCGTDLCDVRALADELIVRHAVFDFEGYRGPATAYVVDTTRTVLAHFFENDDFERILVATVNRGDDADTTGALAGMLAGARFGRAAIPSEWTSRLDPKIRNAIIDQVPRLLALAPLFDGAR